MRVMSALVLGVVLIAGAGMAQDDLPQKLLGKWEITKAGGQAEKGTVLEFKTGGKLAGVIKFQGESVKVEGTYKMAKEKLELTMKFMDTETTEALTVRKLTDDVLELVDKDGQVDELKRVKDKKVW